MPLIVLTADRPPELRGIGAGQTIDQLKLYGSAVRWFCEVGTHEADDAGLLHLRSAACRAYASAAGDARPGPVHLNLAWRDPLGPEPHPDDVTASSPLALEGRGGRPLTAVPRGGGPAPRTAAMDDAWPATSATTLAASSSAAASPTRPWPSRSRPSLGRRATRSSPSQPRSFASDPTTVTSSSRPTTPSRAWGATPWSPSSSSASGTCRRARRCAPGSRGSARCQQVVFDPGFGWSEPTARPSVIVRTDPIALASALAGAVERGRARRLGRALEGRADEAAGEAAEAELERLAAPSEPAVHTALGELYADGDLVYTASSMPIRDQESFLRPGPRRSASWPTAAPTASTASSPRGSARRRRAARRPGSSPATSASSTT